MASAVTQYSISPTLIAHAAGDQITVTFPSGTVLPASISPSDVTINSVAPSAVSVNVSTRKATLTIGTGFSGAAIPIIFSASAGIANPSTTGATSTGISVSTNLQPNAGTTNTYAITGASNLTAANITVTPTTVNTVSQFTAAFNVGSLGALTASTDSVIITFPSGTLVPSSILTSSVTINGVAPASVNTNVSLRRIRMKIGAITVSAGTGVTVVFALSAGIQNPGTAGSYTLSIRTNKEASVTSNSYSVTASTISTPTVSLGTPNPSVASTYTFGFSVGAGGAMTANSSTFTVTFPNGTTLNPATLSASTITVNGTAVTVSPTVNAGSRTVQFTTPVDIGENGAVTLVFSTGITNPATVATYTASIQSSIEPTAITTQSFSIRNSTAVTNFTVARSGTNYTRIKATGIIYTFTFTTSATGAITKTDIITFYFPTGFDISGATITGSTGFGTSQAGAAVTRSGTTLFMTVDGGATGQVGNNSTCSITVSGVTNSNIAKTDNMIGVTTNSDLTTVYTPAFVLFDDTQITGVSVTPTPTTINTTAAYAFSFTNANETTLKGGRDTVYVTFPSGTTLPATLANDAVKVNGISAYSVSKSGQTVYVVIPGDIAASATVAVNFSADAGIISNTTLTSQNATVKVSATTTAQNASFTLTALTTISTPSVTPSTFIKSSTDVQYTISFSTNNALTTSDSIVVVFPAGMLPNNSTAQTRYTSVKVNGSYLTLGTQLKVYGDNTTLALKTPVAVSANTTTTLILETGFGITNPSSATSYTLDARTTTDATPVTSNSFTITNSTISGLTVSVSPSTISTTGDYTFAFTTGAGGALSGGSGKIYLIFPYASPSSLPATIAPGNVTVNSVAASAVQVSKANATNQDTVIVTITNSIGNGASVSVNLTTSAAITNPSSASSSYQAKAYTDAEPTAVPSASYTISAANAVTNVLVTNQSSQVASSANVSYTVTFVQPGASVVTGNLIYLTFPTGFTLATTPTTTVNGTAVTINTALAGNTYTITVPAGINVTAGNTITLVVSGTGKIQNPATAGSSYTVSVYTSAGAAQQVSSSPFTIVANTAPTAGNVTVSPNTANTTAAYTIAFTTSANGKLVTGDKIFITFPTGTTVPSTIPASAVSVNGTVCSVAPSVAGQVVTLTVPSQINVSTAVSVNFNLSSGLLNPPAATYTAGTGLSLYTTINNVSVTENAYTIVANTNLTPATVTLSPSTVNTISQNTLSFTNGNSSVTASDYFEVIFPAGTVIPSAISTSTVSINGVTPTTVTTTPASNLVKVYPGSTVTADQAVSLVFNQAAGIQNPSTSGGKTLTVSKNSVTAITSSSYTVTTSTGTAATVSVSPSTNNVTGGYTLTYSAGVGGALTANSGTITVTFPSGTTVPASISANQITVNSTPVSVNPTTNTTNRTVTFVTPVNIANSGSVVIVFSTGAAITNPASVASNYTLTVASSAEPTAVTSQVYAISSATDVGVATVTTVSNLISTATNYTVSFLTNSTFSMGSTTVTLAFPTGTTLGTLTGNVQIGANNANYQTVGTISTSGLQVTLTIPAASGFTGSSDVCWVKFNANSITNPSTAGSNKTLSVKQGSGNFVTSNRYTIVTTGTVTGFTVSPSPNTGNSPAAYSVAFTTGSNGALFAGDAVAITFPAGTSLPGSIAASAISVNSVSATVAPSILGQVLTIYIPDNISVSSSVSITIALSAGITNPTAGSKTATLTTTSQTGTATSSSYTIINSSNITSATVTLSNTTVKTTSSYQFDFTNGTADINAGGTLAVTFAAGYTLPGTITTGNVTVQSGSPLVTRTISSVGKSGQIITLTLGASQTIAASTPVRVIFAVGAALVNPSTSGATYTVSIAATGNGSATSSNYSITASTITTPALTLGNSAISATTTNSIAFTTGAAGALTSGVSTITVTFPAGTTVPGSITASNISVNGVDASTVSSNAGTRVVTITSPVSVTDNGSVTVLFKTGAGIVNPSAAGSYTLSVYTSAETTPVNSGTYTITTGSTITSPTVARTSTVSSATSTYTITFNLGGQIVNGNFIYVSFPAGTVVSGVTTANSTINSVAPSAVSITGQEVRLTNNAGTIANSATVTLVFTGLTNPATAVSNYTLSAKTNVENNYVASSRYKVIAASNTMTPAIVTNSDNFINANATYTITYTNGSNGKLLTGDKIYLNFPSGYTLSQIASGSVQVNNAATTTATTVSGQTFTVTTPVDINAGASVTINLLDATKIKNEGFPGPKTILISTDIETSAKTSTSYLLYYLDGSLPVELSSFTVKQNKGAVLIEWTTESELDNAMFKVFRTDEATGEANEITRITGMGTKSSRTDYKYLDKLVTAGKKYSYQLVDYSYDGTESIHDAISIEIETPKVFNLEQNYPNPFNPETTVPFAVPFKANVTLEVYNILGQRVKVLANDVYEPGVYSLVWNGRNDNGEMATTGVYFIRMQAASFSKVLKMTLLK